MIVNQNSVIILLFSVVLSTIIFGIAKYLWERRWLYYCASKFDGPFAFPLIGSAHHFIGGQKVFLEKIMGIFEKYQPLSKLWLGNTLYIITSRPKDIELVMNNYLEKAPFYKIAVPLIGNGLLMAPVDLWRKHRKIISLTFNQRILNSFVEIFVAHSHILVERLNDCVGKGYVDIFPIISQCTLNMISETSMGTEIKEMQGTSHYMNWLLRCEKLMTYRFFHVWFQNDFIWKLSSMSKELNILCNKIWDFIREIVEAKRSKIMIANNLNHSNSDDIIPKRKIFLDLLIDITDKENKWTNEELMEEAQTMVLGGSETTAIIESYVVTMLAMHQDVQSKVYDELFSIFGDSDRPPCPEDLTKMIYLEQVIMETLRLFPIAPFLGRYVHNDIQLEQHVIPKGSVVLIPLIYLHRKPEIWDNPLEFNPDRFLPEMAAKRERYSYLPFSVGPRDCIGKRYAMMSMKILISAVLRHFKLISTEYKSVKDIKLQINVMIKAINGWKVQLERRQTKTF